MNKAKRKPKTKFNKELARELKLQGLTNKEIGEELNCAAITCCVNLSEVKVNKYFKAVRGKFIVYEFYDNNNECIYVGQSTVFDRRFMTHKHKSKFFNEICYVVTYEFESIPDMTFFEAQLILIKSPKYNSRLKNSPASKFSIDYVNKSIFNTKGVQISKIL